MVREYLAARPGRGPRPDPGRQGAGRAQQGAVSNALARLEAAGEARLVSDSPRRYRIVAEPVGDQVWRWSPPRRPSAGDHAATRGNDSPRRGVPRATSRAQGPPKIFFGTNTIQPAPRSLGRALPRGADLAGRVRAGPESPARSPGFGERPPPARGDPGEKRGTPRGAITAPQRKELLRGHPPPPSHRLAVRHLGEHLRSPGEPDPIRSPSTAPASGASRTGPSRSASSRPCCCTPRPTSRPATPSWPSSSPAPSARAARGPSAWPGCSCRGCVGPCGHWCRSARARPTTSRPRLSPPSWPRWPG